MEIELFPIQDKFIFDQSRIAGAFAGKRGAKTTGGAVRAILFQEEKPGWVANSIDPYMGGVIAPNYRMCKNLSIAKLQSYGRSFISKYTKSNLELTWHDDSIIRGYTDDHPEALEGEKLNWIWIDEIFQCKEQTFLEALARVSDSRGHIWCTGSLGVQYQVPKHHWAWKYFKDPNTLLEGSVVYEWSTADNPYFPKDELERLRRTLDPKTFRQMFEISWDVASNAAIYEDLDEANQREHDYRPDWETSISIDWGWKHDMAVGFFQINPKTQDVHLFDEIVAQGMTLEKLISAITAKNYRIKNWYCDAAGTQTREQTGISNVKWFHQRGIHFKYRRTAISYGIPIVRSFIRNGMGQAKFFIDPRRCRKSWDQLLSYRYKEKDGILTEDIVQEKDDCPDMIRYYFVNRHDIFKPKEEFSNMDRWGTF